MVLPSSPPLWNALSMSSGISTANTAQPMRTLLLLQTTLPHPHPMTEPHHNQKGAAPRVRLGGGPFIDAVTKAQLDLWHKRGISYGVIIDRLATYAVFSGFDPVSITHPKPNSPKPVKA